MAIKPGDKFVQNPGKLRLLRLGNDSGEGHVV
jgi:hypothetical protein